MRAALLDAEAEGAAASPDYPRWYAHRRLEGDGDGCQRGPRPLGGPGARQAGRAGSCSPLAARRCWRSWPPRPEARWSWPTSPSARTSTLLCERLGDARRAGRQRGSRLRRADRGPGRGGDRQVHRRQPASTDPDGNTLRPAGDRGRSPWPDRDDGIALGLAPTPNTRMYNATKFGLRGFTLALRQDLDGKGVGVSLVNPGLHPHRRHVRRQRHRSSVLRAARSLPRTWPRRW